MSTTGSCPLAAVRAQGSVECVEFDSTPGRRVRGLGVRRAVINARCRTHASASKPAVPYCVPVGRSRSVTHRWWLCWRSRAQQPLQLAHANITGRRTPPNGHAARGARGRVWLSRRLVHKVCVCVCVCVCRARARGTVAAVATAVAHPVRRASAHSATGTAPTPPLRSRHASRTCPPPSLRACWDGCSPIRCVRARLLWGACSRARCGRHRRPHARHPASPSLRPRVALLQAWVARETRRTVDVNYASGLRATYHELGRVSCGRHVRECPRPRAIAHTRTRATRASPA